MTDQELMELLQRKALEDLTPAEIGLLRRRLPKSEEVRGEVLGQLNLEECLHQQLGSVNVSVELIVNHRDAPPDSRGSGFVSAIALFLCLTFCAVLVLLLTSNRFGSTNSNKPEQRAEEPAQGSPSSSANGDTKVKPGAGVAKDADANPTEIKLSIRFEAEAFSDGNVVVDNEKWGSAKTKVIHSPASPAFAEFQVALPTAGEFELKARYASMDSRPLNLTINGKTAAGFVLGDQTGGNGVQHMEWVSLGKFAFIEGQNSIRLDTPTVFPHIDRFQIVEPEEPLVAAKDADPAGSEGTDKTPATTDDKKPEVAKPAQEPPKEKIPAADKPAVVAADPNKPWQAILADPAESRSFADICFESFDTAKSLPQVETLQKWFEPVAGQPSKFFKQATAVGEAGWIEGLVRLKAPLRGDAGLRLWLDSYNRLRIHCFKGTEGVTLVYYQDFNFRWEAYATTRKPDGITPETFALVAGDENRHSRTEIRHGGPFELRHHQGQLVMSRGDVILMRVPMAEPPEQIYFEGKTAFHGITMTRCKDFPAAAPVAEERVAVAAPADLPWVEQIHAHARLERFEDGSVQLAANKSDKRGWVVTPVPYTGLSEVIFEIEHATPGTGLFLCQENNIPQVILRFVRNTRDGGLCLFPRAQDDYIEGDHATIVERPVPYCRPRVWLRLLVGGGHLRWWTSHDGQHWAETAEVYPLAAGAGWNLGLFHVANQPDLRIKLRRVELRPLRALESLADSTLIKNARSFHLLTAMPAWQTAVDETCPEGQDPAAWRRACAIRTLGAGTSSQLNWDVLQSLLDDPSVEVLSLDERRKLLHEATLLVDGRNQVFQKATINRFNDIAIEAQRTQGHRPYSWIRRDLIRVPFGYRQVLPAERKATIRHELLHLLYEQKWDEAFQFCQRLRFFHQHQQLPLVEWAEHAATDEISGYATVNTANARNPQWRHPLNEELSKDAYNVVAELKAILESEAFDEGARMIAALDAHAHSGVAPHSHDELLFVSLPVAVKLALRHNAELREALSQQFSSLAQLRVRRAIAAGDERAVRLASVQFEGTAAAAQTHRWLGDRALSSGWFSRALWEYEQAQTGATASLRNDLAARRRLTGAMLGQELGQPITKSIQLNDLQLTAAEFESLITEMLARPAPASTKHVTPPPSAPSPSDFDAHVRGRLDGRVGSDPATEVTTYVRQHQVPWVDRQIGPVIAGDALYVSNRFQVAAYDIANGNRRWQSVQPAGKMLRSQDWALTPMFPLIADGRVYVRQLFGHGPKLVCHDQKTGAIIWNAERLPNEFVVSDPMIIQNQLVALVVVKENEQRSKLKLTKFSADTGEVVSSRQLLDLNPAWWVRRFCAATRLENSIVASLGGITVCCDHSGEVRWIRRHIVLPPQQETNWVTQYFQAPISVGGRLYVSQPCVRSVDCLDADTGDLLWRRTLPDIRRIVGSSPDRVLLQTDGGFVALSTDDGAFLWRHEATPILDAHVCGPDGTILYATRVATEADPKIFSPRLAWIDPATGAVTETTDLKGRDDKDPRMGPMLVHNDRLWTFYGRGQEDPIRELVELIPKAKVPKP